MNNHNLVIYKFEELYNNFDSDLKSGGDSDDAETFKRTRPLEGDLVVIPFGRSAQNKEQYVPKVFDE